MAELTVENPNQPANESVVREMEKILAAWPEGKYNVSVNDMLNDYVVPEVVRKRAKAD